MKKLLLSFGALVLVLMGAGCAWGGGAKNEVVSGKWFLSFDLPEGWIMAGEYDAPRTNVVIPNQEVNQEMKTIVLQSTSKAVVRNSQAPGAEVSADTYVLESYTVVDVYKLDPRFVISKSAEDLGNGFAAADGKYFFTASDGSRYQFVVKTNNQSDEAARQVILSAKLVTNYVGSVTNGAVGEVKTNE